MEDVEQRISDTEAQINECQAMLDRIKDENIEEITKFTTYIVQNTLNPEQHQVEKLQEELKKRSIDVDLITLADDIESWISEPNFVMLIMTAEMYQVFDILTQEREKRKNTTSPLYQIIPIALPGISEPSKKWPAELRFFQFQITNDNEAYDMLIETLKDYIEGIESKHKLNQNQTTGEIKIGQVNHNRFAPKEWEFMVKQLIRNNAESAAPAPFVPVIGSKICEYYFDSEDEIVQKMLRNSPYPLDEEPLLARVLQFLSHGGTDGLIDIKKDLAKIRYKTPSEVEPLRNPLKILAKLPFPIYFTANHDRLLEQSLEDENRKPRIVDLFNIKQVEEVIDPRNEDKKIDLQHPVVFHLFGHIDDQRISDLKVTESEFIEMIFKLGAGLDSPFKVQSHILNSPFLFLGFDIHDWHFQVSLRIFWKFLIDRQQKNIACISPSIKNDADIKRVYDYVENYLLNVADFTTSFQDPLSFLLELEHRYNKVMGGYNDGNK